MKEFEVQIRLRNNLIKRRRLELGLTAQVAAKACGLSYSTFIKYEGLGASPICRRTTEWRPSARRLAEFFGLTPEQLFPDAVLAVKRPTVSIEANAERVLALARMGASGEEVATPDHLLERKEMSKDAFFALARLPERERKIIEAVVLGDETQVVAGEMFMSGRSRARVGAVLERALSKVREEVVEKWGYER